MRAHSLDAPNPYIPRDSATKRNSNSTSSNRIHGEGREGGGPDGRQGAARLLGEAQLAGVRRGRSAASTATSTMATCRRLMIRPFDLMTAG